MHACPMYVERGAKGSLGRVRLPQRSRNPAARRMRCLSEGIYAGPCGCDRQGAERGTHQSAQFFRLPLDDKVTDVPLRPPKCWAR